MNTSPRKQAVPWTRLIVTAERRTLSVLSRCPEWIDIVIRQADDTQRDARCHQPKGHFFLFIGPGHLQGPDSPCRSLKFAIRDLTASVSRLRLDTGRNPCGPCLASPPPVTPRASK